MGGALLVAALLSWGGWLGLRGQPAMPAAAKLGNADACRHYDGLPPGWPVREHAGMVHLPGGRFELGSQRGYREERPQRPARVVAFWIDRTEVTNAQFAAFVRATGHVTEAERRGEAVLFERPHDPQVRGLLADGWWRLARGASWRHPDGPGSTLAGRHAEPVVQVTRADAEAYAGWLGRRLPTEAEWEYAALAGRDDAAADAALRTTDGRWLANVWQGDFPWQAVPEDGFPGRAPAGCFPASPFGLHDMAGNVWEWAADPWRADHGPLAPARVQAGLGVIKGGSYLCAAGYCVRARSAARQPQEPDLPMAHLGFRTVAD